MWRCNCPTGRFSNTTKNPGEVAFGGDPIRVLTRFGGNSGLNAVQLLLSGVFDRFPKLKIYWAETQIGWLPYYYDQLDDVYKRSKHWMERYFGLKPLRQRAERNIFASIFAGDLFTTASVLRLRYDDRRRQDHVGQRFPHSAGDWPNSRRVTDDICAGLPEDERNGLLGGNAAKFFQLNRARQ